MAGIFCRVILAASLIGSFWSAVYAASEAGIAVAVDQSARLTGGNGKRTLTAGMPVSIGERIKTGRTGQVQIIFTDDTKLVVGPNSSLIIETYLLRSKNTVNKLAIKALGGTFRFISGKSPKLAYSVKTPTGTIGIRGTSFDFTVRRMGDTDLVLFSGEVEFCGNGGCIRLKDACSLASAPRNADVNLVRSLERRNRQIRARFPYIVSQAPLRSDFRVSTRSCGDIQKARLKADPRITGSVGPRVAAPPAPEPSAPEPPEPPEPSGEPGNPGNGGANGNAGASPGGNDMGDRQKGRSDNNPGKGNNRGNGNGSGNGNS